MKSIVMDGDNRKNQERDDRSNSIHTFNLTKTFNNFHAVESLSISVNPGDIFGFLGPNGAGKTTTIRMLCGLISPTSGTGKIAGLDIVKDSLKIKKIIGLLPESSGFYSWMNAREYLVYFAALYKIEEQIAKKRIQNLIEKMGLATKSTVPIGYYSRGMKQRLGLARTLINEPKIIFLDEPTLGLDPKGQQDIQRILVDLNRENHVTIFFSSHALNEVSSLCNRIAIVNKGRLVAEGSIDELRKLVGDSSEYLLIRLLNLPDTQKALSNIQLPIKINSNINNPTKEFIDVSVLDAESHSINKVLEIFISSGLQIYEIKRMNRSLEDIFFKLTDSKKEQKLHQDIKPEISKNIDKNQNITGSKTGSKLQNHGGEQ